ncbi:MAG: dihydrolipoyl dehydrogenase [Candidatus Latescibacteria bacterium]|nr:dihydrolipoyl dehydrogenase [Candidatus Latescibacterota bacterium]NIO01029.1 dihydrolipoyl dehydrogenase [Candidatus Latescibacterota bacterium]NIO27428.1 dihydrolipoyl dehydrogenase [Candidatus Latescibacterota bacterium]NIO54950.1 dihydrolipoyl dehydrogenase [Candidatus Latescibacterota bacterium]NIT01039.1 dihydrolipoyl dehydrogenase [Candidatus Latescibacterota bacterium]
MKQYQLVIIGSGPGGYVAAIRAGILGLKTAIVEKEKLLGGTCLHWGCIPTKALLHTAYLYDEIKEASEYGIRVGDISIDYKKVHSRKTRIVRKLAKGIEYLMNKRKVDVFKGTGILADSRTVIVSNGKDEETLKAENTIVATGSIPSHLPHIVPDGKTLLNSDHVLTMEEIPKSLAVIGAGAVGMEFASIFASFGTEVHVVEILPQVLPLEDEDVAAELEKSFKGRGVLISTSSEVKSVEKTAKGAKLQVTGESGASELEVEKVLLSVGRRPATEGIGLEDVGIDTAKGFIAVNEFMQTRVPNIYAIGDVVQTPLLAHVASAEGITAVEHIAGKSTRSVDYNKIPSCTYCRPEVASIGLSEKRAQEAGYPVKTGRFPFSAIGKAGILGETGGFVKIVSEGKYGEILGVHIIGPKATELIAEACAAMNLETTVEDVIRTVHPHPTLSEAMAEAAHSVYGEAIHM